MSGIKPRLDPLIEERAPWLFSGRPGTEIAHRILNKMLGYGRAVELGDEFLDQHPDAIMARMAELIARDVEVTGLENLPEDGPALIVANHPTGIADGIILHHLIAPIRPDLFFYANSDILRILPQFESMIAPVEWREDKRSRQKTRETMVYTRKAIDDGRLGVIFPSGRLAKRRGLRLFEREWMTSAAMIARKFDLPVVPLNMRARNSALFYLFDAIHPTLRDITLFHETLNKAGQPYRVNIGQPIMPGAMPKTSEEAIDVLREQTLALGGRYAPTVNLLDVTRMPAVMRRNLLPSS